MRSLRHFITRYKEELIMLILAFTGSSALGIFAISHIYGLFNVLSTIFIVSVSLTAIVVLYQKFLAQRLYNFVLNTLGNRETYTLLKQKLTSSFENSKLYAKNKWSLFKS